METPENIGDNWESLRQRVIWRDGGKCFICGSRRALTGHHIKARDAGGEDTMRNLITLCEKCHNYVEGEDWAFILSMKHEKEEEVKYKNNPRLRMKYGSVISMYRLIDGELVKIGERYE